LASAEMIKPIDSIMLTFLLAATELQTAVTEFHEEVSVNKGPSGDNTKGAQKIKTASDFL